MKFFYLIHDEDIYHCHTWYQTGKEYTAAVEAKQVAQQEAQRAQFIVEKAKQERQQRVVQAEGEARAAQMISFDLYLSNIYSEYSIQEVCEAFKSWCIPSWKISIFLDYFGGNIVYWALLLEISIHARIVRLEV